MPRNAQSLPVNGRPLSWRAPSLHPIKAPGPVTLACPACGATVGTFRLPGEATRFSSHAFDSATSGETWRDTCPASGLTEAEATVQAG